MFGATSAYFHRKLAPEAETNTTLVRLMVDLVKVTRDIQNLHDTLHFYSC